MKIDGLKMGKEPAAGLIGEMMLARTVLEEKNELLDRKDRRIVELLETARRLEAEREELRAELRRTAAERDAARQAEGRAGELRVVDEVARMAMDHLPKEADGWDLSSRLLRHFRERYGLELIDQAGGRVDPERHQVVEVVGSPDSGEGTVQVLVPGFRLAGRTARPALVRVVQGGSSCPA